MARTRKPRRFWWKLAISYFLFALGSLFLAGLYLALVFIPRARTQGEILVQSRVDRCAHLLSLTLASADRKIELSQALDVFSAPRDPFIWIFNEKGEVLYSSRKARESGFTPESPVVGEAAHGVTRTGVSKGGRVYYHAAPLVYESRQMGCLYLALPVNMNTRNRIEALLPVGQAFFLIALLSLLVALVMARKIIRPLEEMTETARTIGDGDLSRRVGKASFSEEIGILGETLNLMAGKLQETIESLEEEKEQLRTMEKTRRELAASISHEVRTPLATIQGCAEALRDGVVHGVDAVRYLETINREVVRLDRLMNDLLELSKLEAGAVTLEKEAYPAHALFHDIVARKAAGLDTACITTEITGDDISLYVDRERFSQVLLNLFENTIRYCPAGTRIVIATREWEGRAEITYEDNGPGVPAADLPRLFDRFFRVEKSRSRAQGGCGLGLAIARNLVELHGGTMNVHPGDPHGLCFVIAIPGQGAEGREHQP